MSRIELRTPKLAGVVCVVALFLGGLAVAEEATNPDATTTQNEEPTKTDDDEVVCKTLKVTGSRLGRHKICLTKAEWRKSDSDGRQVRRDLSGKGTNPTKGN
jgi:hypothetical protein